MTENGFTFSNKKIVVTGKAILLIFVNDIEQINNEDTSQFNTILVTCIVNVSCPSGKYELSVINSYLSAAGCKW